MKRAFANRVDATATALIAEAKAYGATYLPINGTVDGVLCFRNQLFVVDWKGPKTKLTRRQAALVAEGFPVWFLRTSEDLRKLLFGDGTL